MPDDTDAPTQKENDAPDEERGDDTSRDTPTRTALQALRAMLDPAPADPFDDDPNP